MSNHQMQISKDLPNKKLIVTRAFDADVKDVWRAWTEKEILDQWWAPKPYKAETKSLDFTVGGSWIYAMVSPEGEKQWVRVSFTDIQPLKSFSAYDAFADENGNPIPNPPGMKWHNQFIPTEDGCKVVVEITFASEADFNKILEMGFESGFEIGLNNLEEYLGTN